MKKKKKALIISYSNLHTDPRILRQIEFLSEEFTIHTAGLFPSNHPAEVVHQTISNEYKIHFHKSYSPLIRKFITLVFVIPIYLFIWFWNYLNLVLTKNYETAYWSTHRKSTLKMLLSFDFDLVVANDIDTLPLAIKIKSLNGGKVYFDAHEYSPLEYENDTKWLKQKSPYLLYLCKKYIPLTDYSTTVAHKIAEKYKELTGKHFDVVYNSPQFQSLDPSEVVSKLIRCVHHGVASPIRKIESMIQAFIELGEAFELNLLLMVNDKKYFIEMQELAKDHSNIVFHEPVPTKDISKFINQYDVSLIFIPPVNFNYKYCLPNKFFESVQARLMLLCGPSAEMEYLINKYQLGKISSGFKAEDIKSSIQNISVEEIKKFKINSDQVAELLAAETIMKNLNNRLHQVCAE